MNDRLTQMLIAMAALAAVAAVLAGPVGASSGPSPSAAVVPYMSHGIGVDASQFSGQASQTIPYLSQGVGVDTSQFAGQAPLRLTGVHAGLVDRHSLPNEPQSLGLNGDSPLTRVSAPEPEGLTGDGALTRVRKTAPPAGMSGGNDIDWTSFGAGAGMAALAAAGLVGILLTVRRRHTVGTP